MTDVRQKLQALSQLINDEHEAHIRVAAENPEHFYGDARFTQMQALCHEINSLLELKPMTKKELETLGWFIEEGRQQALGTVGIRYAEHMGLSAAKHLGIEVRDEPRES